MARQPSYGAAVLIFNPQGLVLVSQRHDLKTWVYPGGHSEPGETPVQTAVREAKEETGLDVEIKKLAIVYINAHPLRRTVGYFFVAEATGGELKGQPGEVLDIRWVEPEELPSLVSARHYRRYQIAVQDTKKVHLEMRRSFNVPFWKIPAFWWRRGPGKKLGLVKV